MPAERRVSGPELRELVFWPALVTLAVTLLRFVGEMLHWSPRFFSREAGGAGALVGMTTATAIRGLGVVIPAPLVWKAAAHVLEHGRTSRGYLGIVTQEVALPEHQREGLTGESGLLVLGVAPGSPAAAAGVLVGDVLAALDDKPVASPDDVLDALTGTEAGRAAVLRLLRGGKAINLAVTVGERPAR